VALDARDETVDREVTHRQVRLGRSGRRNGGQSLSLYGRAPRLDGMEHAAACVACGVPMSVHGTERRLGRDRSGPTGVAPELGWPTH